MSWSDGLKVSAFAGALVWLLLGCDVGSNPLAPYGASRPLTFLRVTQSFSPDVQWVGGRAAAIGVNRGDRAALDSTLVWLRTAAADEIESPITIGRDFDVDAVEQVGGSPADSLESGVRYTIWVAQRSAFEAGLAGADAFALADTSLEVSYLLLGRSGGGVSVAFEIFRDQKLLRDSYTVRWSPEIGFRRLAIREASLGGYTDLLWHVVLPDSVEADFRPPVVIGETPPGAVVATEWSGWGSGTQTLWAATREWDEQSFSPRAAGYAFFQMFSSNFEE